MDTRNKILTAEAAVEAARGVKSSGGKLTVVVGTFDVVVAAHARSLGEVRNGIGGGMLMVVLVPAVEPLLAERARAELVAGLNMVDYVVVAGEGGIEELLRRLGADGVICRQAADEQEQRRLIEDVQRRHSR